MDLGRCTHCTPIVVVACSHAQYTSAVAVAMAASADLIGPFIEGGDCVSVLGCGWPADTVKLRVGRASVLLPWPAALALHVRRRPGEFCIASFYVYIMKP